MPSLRSLLGRGSPPLKPQPLPRKTGLNVLHEPETPGSWPTILSIVFVHGLNGHYIHTWEESSVCWPRDLLPSRIQNVRVLSFSYDADIYNSASVGRIRDHGLNLLTQLIAKRPQTGREKFTRPIVFVAHSLGGLLVKEALREARQHSEDMGRQAILTATRGFVFFSTPHGGSTKDAWLQIADRFAPLSTTSTTTNPLHRLGLGLSRGRISPLVEALKQNASSLYDLVQDFRHLAEHYALISLYETEAYGSGSSSSRSRPAVIVDKLSALTFLPHEEALGIPASHTEMCRFASAEDPWFGRVVKRIERAARGRGGAMVGPGVGRGEFGFGGVRVVEEMGEAPVVFAVGGAKGGRPLVVGVKEITDGSETGLSAGFFYDHGGQHVSREALAYGNVKVVG